MNTLEKLISQLCPDGVEYKPLGDYCSYVRGVTYSKEQESSSQINSIGLLRANNIELTSSRLLLEDVKYIKSTAKINSMQWLKKGDILICAGSGSREHIGKVAFIEHDMDYVFGGFMAVVRCKEKLDSKFLFHVLRSGSFKNHLGLVLNSSTINNLKSECVYSFQLPLPPLPVQKEIVRMLDDMAGLIDALEEELAARKQQYEWCRERLLRNVDDVEGLRESQGKRIKRLGTLVDEGLINMTRGDYITKKDALPGDVPVILGGQEPAYFINRFNHSGKAIVISRSGASAGFVSYWNEPIFVTDGFAFDCDESYLNTRYLFYVLKRHQGNLNMMKKGGGVPHITGENLKAMELNLPPLSEQQRIVKILDSFDTLCNSMTEGLPGEIALRKQQYEYYRDKLLAFKRKPEVA